jgi:hypothetical protein
VGGQRVGEQRTIEHDGKGAGLARLPVGRHTGGMGGSSGFRHWRPHPCTRAGVSPAAAAAALTAATAACLLGLAALSEAAVPEAACWPRWAPALAAALDAAGLGGLLGGAGTTRAGTTADGRRDNAHAVRERGGSDPHATVGWAAGRGSLVAAAEPCWAEAVYGLQLLVPDATPNLGQAWYLLTEAFKEYLPLFR